MYWYDEILENIELKTNSAFASIHDKMFSEYLIENPPTEVYGVDNIRISFQSELRVQLKTIIVKHISVLYYQDKDFEILSFAKDFFNYLNPTSNFGSAPDITIAKEIHNKTLHPGSFDIDNFRLFSFDGAIKTDYSVNNYDNSDENEKLIFNRENIQLAIEFQKQFNNSNENEVISILEKQYSFTNATETPKAIWLDNVERAINSFGLFKEKSYAKRDRVKLWFKEKREEVACFESTSIRVNNFPYDDYTYRLFSTDLPNDVGIAFNEGDSLEEYAKAKKRTELNHVLFKFQDNFKGADTKDVIALLEKQYNLSDARSIPKTHWLENVKKIIDYWHLLSGATTEKRDTVKLWFSQKEKIVEAVYTSVVSYNELEEFKDLNSDKLYEKFLNAQDSDIYKDSETGKNYFQWLVDQLTLQRDNYLFAHSPTAINQGELDVFDIQIDRAKKRLAICISQLADPENTKALADESINAQRVKSIIQLGENKRTEYKSTLRYCLKQKAALQYIEHSVLKTIAAFLNSDGGTLLVGVADDGTLLGLENDYSTFGKNKNYQDEWIKHFDNIPHHALGNALMSNIKLEFVTIDETAVAIIDIKTAATPVFMKNKAENNRKQFYIRRSVSTVELDAEETVTYVKQKWG